MISIGLIVVLVLVVMLLIVFFKLRELKHHIGLVVIIGILLFFTLTFGKIYSANKTDITTFEGLVQVLKIYTSWLAAAGANLFKVAGYAVHQDWGINATASGP